MQTFDRPNSNLEINLFLRMAALQKGSSLLTRSDNNRVALTEKDFGEMNTYDCLSDNAVLVCLSFVTSGSPLSSVTDLK